uniref:Solute carrier family 41 member n=1 Tax=Callorhinus ursinus TaxID=34884 RepID=A0A3Q7NKR6_CALUR|nr:solute carrier family 41 member 3-like [Callorhinus ursinus]XP_025721984.1 solute carrier family 41 member 3-like [Callorhinus ursinus]
MLMVCIVIGARKLGLNPDNIATPIAASLGDLTTLSLLAFVSSFFYKHKDNRYLTPLLCISFMALIPIWVLIAKQNPPIMKILKFGWFPIILAMVISSFGGLILNKTISKQQYQGMAIFTPIICGRYRQHRHLGSSVCWAVLAPRARAVGSDSSNFRDLAPGPQSHGHASAGQQLLDWNVSGGRRSLGRKPCPLFHQLTPFSS